MWHWMWNPINLFSMNSGFFADNVGWRGAAALARVEELARELGYSEVFVRPSPLDAEIEPDRLARFYTSRGYSECRQDSQLLAKTLHQQPQSA